MRARASVRSALEANDGKRYKVTHLDGLAKDEGCLQVEFDEYARDVNTSNTNARSAGCRMSGKLRN